MNGIIKSGLSFGFTSGVITTLGLMVGLHAGTHSKLAVIGGILTIAIADAMSDALGMHISKESENVASSKQIWILTTITFLAKFFIALTFLVPLFLVELNLAIVICIIWGFFILTILSFLLARSQHERPLPIIFEHVAVGAVVVAITHLVGDWISTAFGQLG